MKEQFRRATDHRALVLEVVATIPEAATRDAIQHEAFRYRTDDRFGMNQISAMVSHLLRQGLIARREDATLFITGLGLDWLKNAMFDRSLPEPHTRPGRRRSNQK